MLKQLFLEHIVFHFIQHICGALTVYQKLKSFRRFIYIRVDNWFRKYGCYGFNRTCFRWYKIFPASWITGTIVYSLCNYCNDSGLHFVCARVCVRLSLFCLLLLFCSIISKWAAVFEIQFQVWQVYSAEQSTQRLQWPVLKMVYVAEVAPVAPLLFAIYLD